METESNRLPIDFEEIKKGDVITEQQLEEIFHISSHSEKYPFLLMQLRSQIEQRCGEFGNPVVVRECKGNLEILDDETAATYTNHQFKHNMGRLMRTYERQCIVDTAKLSEVSQKTHFRRMEINGKTVQGALMARRGKIKLEPYRRNTPILASG